jgi:hypothetical protein
LFLRQTRRVCKITSAEAKGFKVFEFCLLSAQSQEDTMKRSLIWFALLYGEMTALILALLGLQYATETQTGREWCDGLFSKMILCRSSLFSVTILVFSFVIVKSMIQLITTYRKPPND